MTRHISLSNRSSLADREPQSRTNGMRFGIGLSQPHSTFRRLAS
jgi:hypothetical protein